MIIKPITVEQIDGQDPRVSSTFILDEAGKEEKVVFFSVNKEFGGYLVSEVADAFCLAAILPALVSGQDIFSEAPLSDYFFYHSKTLIYLLGKVFGYPAIEIRCNEIIHTDFKPTAVASGFSGGVDSLTTFIKHTETSCPEEFRLTHLALLNVGSYGNDYEKIKEKFEKDADRAREFANYVGMPLVLVSSNINDLYSHPDIYHFALRLTVCLSAGILCMQKLWKTYFISSGITIDEMRLSKYDQYYYDNSITQLLSNNNTTIINSEAYMNRVEKTKLLAGNPLAQKFLHVCAADILNEKQGTDYRKDTKPNCSECFKCIRTMFTLDYLGALDEFRGRFDPEKYYMKVKPRLEYEAYLGKDHYQREIFALMKEKGFEPSLKMKVRKYLFLRKRAVKRKLKRIFRYSK